MSAIRTISLIAVFIFSGLLASAQHTPINPIANRVFTPFMINPAIAGSKDFMAIDLSATVQGDDFSQLLSGNTRIAHKGPRYVGAPVGKSFTNLGAGGSLFNDHYGPSRSLGVSAAASYHIPLSDKNISFISGGIAVKGIYNVMDSIADLGALGRESIIPNIDAGIYLYSKNLYAGISATNLLGSMTDSVDMAIYDIPISRQYFFLAGYKIVLSRSLNIVLEPSIIINLDDSLDFKSRETYNPMLKLYMDAFCVGAYLHDYNNLTFFFQYKFPKLYIGTLVDFPRNVPFYKRDLTVEIAAGFNFGGVTRTAGSRYQW
ncbi:MAG: PorP/SprF family type IX secretion system membrane protein [Bacteroidales bacterium]|nr:PorP/SprF family type IX secretion system membrane protein [Bacteroidales bacterium]